MSSIQPFKCLSPILLHIIHVIKENYGIYFYKNIFGFLSHELAKFANYPWTKYLKNFDSGTQTKFSRNFGSITQNSGSGYNFLVGVIGFKLF